MKNLEFTYGGAPAGVALDFTFSPSKALRVHSIDFHSSDYILSGEYSIKLDSSSGEVHDSILYSGDVTGTKGYSKEFTNRYLSNGDSIVVSCPATPAVSYGVCFVTETL